MLPESQAGTADLKAALAQEEERRQQDAPGISKALIQENATKDEQEKYSLPVEDTVRIRPEMIAENESTEPHKPESWIVKQIADSDSSMAKEAGRLDGRENVNPPFNHENQTMKANKLAALIVTTYISFSSTAHASAPQPVFSPEQEARIGEIAADYLVSHPEILVTVSNKLQEQQETRKQKMFALNVMENQANLLHDPDTPAYGPDTAKVAVIEFFDYQCVFCSRFAPELEKVMKAQPDVRYLFKEWPIFGGRWEASLQAAQQGLTVWQQKGPQAYVTYHNAIYATGHNEGKLTAEDILAAASKAGLAASVPGDHTASLEKNSNLAEELGLTGTPGIVVMPVSGATPDTITVFPEAVTADRLQAAIRKASR